MSFGAYPLVFRPLLFRLDAERAHALACVALKLKPARAPARPGALAVRVAGVDLPNPLGLAAGFDKNAEVIDAMFGLGFGFVEIGTVTPRPQAGNPRPRLFRLGDDAALINRMGFNNEGLAKVRARLAARGQRPGVIGLNVGANKDSPDRIADYLAGIRGCAPFADYLTVNISSPNTPGLRDLQGEAELQGLLAAIAAERQAGDPPVFLKLAPDLDPAACPRIVDAVLKHGIAGLIIGNTTLSRPSSLRAANRGEAGGLSGAPLAPLALQRLKDFNAVARGALPLIAVGGIASAEDVWARIAAGASLVQLYTALIYQGPGLVRGILRGLDARLQRDGFATLAQAIAARPAG